MKNSYVLDGTKFDTLYEFFDEIIRLMTDDIDFEPGHNMSALADILRGGFGKHEYGEDIELTWTHFERSRELLTDEVVLTIIEVIVDAEDDDRSCILRIER